MSTPGPTPAAPPPPSANATAPKPKKAPLPPLELTEEEMAVVNKWTSAYEKTIASKDRLRMLSEQILPRLTPLNRHLSEDAWRIHKSQVKLWFQNTFRRPSALTRLSLTRKASLKQVACHIYKKEIAAIASRRANGARPGTQQYMPIFQAAVNEFMATLDEDALLALENERADRMIAGQPTEIKRKTAERMGHSYLDQSAKVQYNEMGRRMVAWEFHENKAGMRLFSFHDINEDLGPVKVQSFTQKFPEAVENFKGAWFEYMKYCYRVESGAEAPAAQNRSTYSLMELDRDVKGFPILPPVEEKESLPYMKRMVQSFVTAHYRFASGRRHERVPWKQIKEHTADFIDDEYLPAQPTTDVRVAPIDDPSDMKKEQIARLVEHWRRPIPACNLFRFSHVLVNSKTDATTPALYEDSQGPHTVAQTRPHIGADTESGESTQPRTMATTLGWDEEYRAANPLQFSPGPDDINMHDYDQPGPDSQLEQVIDPQLIGQSHTGEGILVEPTAPLVASKNKNKKQTKAPAKAAGKKKAETRPRAKNTSAMPDDVEVPEPTTTVEKPRPRPRPLNPRLMPANSRMDHADSAVPDESGDPREFQPAPPQMAPTMPPVHETPADTNLAEMAPPELNLTGPPHPALADLNSTEAESTELGRPRHQPVKRKLDACLTLQFKAAEEKEAREREKLLARKRKGVAPPTKRQRIQ